MVRSIVPEATAIRAKTATAKVRRAMTLQHKKPKLRNEERLTQTTPVKRIYPTIFYRNELDKNNIHYKIHSVRGTERETAANRPEKAVKRAPWARPIYQGPARTKTAPMRDIRLRNQITSCLQNRTSS
jgi:hypothetical protein